MHKALFSLLIFIFASTSAYASSCNTYLAEETLSLSIQKELDQLNKHQKSKADYIQKDWANNIWDKQKRIYDHGFFKFIKADPEAFQILKKLGFRFSEKDQTVSYPFYIWNFLESAKNLVSNTPERILPAVVLVHIASKKLMFITKPSDLPENSNEWHTPSGELDEDIYYKAIQNGFLPITLGTDHADRGFEDHEIQHLVSFYHPDNFPNYMKESKKMAELFATSKVTSKAVFLFAEAFAFVRDNKEAKEHFYSFADRWDLNFDSFADLKKQVSEMPAPDAELLSKQFLEAYPKYVFYRGGLIRDSYTIPAIKNNTDFLSDWLTTRTYGSLNTSKGIHYVDQFREQNWRMLYKNLVITHNAVFNDPINYTISSTHLGWMPYALEEFCLEVRKSVEEKYANYHRMALAELIWAIHQSYKLNMTSTELMHTALHPDHPKHLKVKKYFEEAYASLFKVGDKNRSVYNRAFSK